MALFTSLAGFSQSGPSKDKGQIISFIMLPSMAERTTQSEADKGVSFLIDTLNGDHTTVSLSPGVDAGPYVRKSRSGIDALKRVPNPEAGKPDLYVALAHADFPASWVNVLVLVMADSKGQNMRLTALDQGLEKLPQGHLGITNITAMTISIKLGDEVVVLAPREQGSIRIKSSSNKTGPAMYSMQIATQIDGQWQLETGSRLALDPAQRRIALIFSGPQTRTQHYILYPAPPDPTDDGPPADLRDLPPSNSSAH